MTIHQHLAHRINIAKETSHKRLHTHTYINSCMGSTTSWSTRQNPKFHSKDILTIIVANQNIHLYPARITKYAFFVENRFLFFSLLLVGFSSIFFWNNGIEDGKKFNKFSHKRNCKCFSRVKNLIKLFVRLLCIDY